MHRSVHINVCVCFWFCLVLCFHSGKTHLVVTDHVMGHPVLGAHMRETEKMVPDSWEWSIPSPVGNQGTCGACFAFSTVAQLEAWVDAKIDLNVTDVANCVSPDCSGASLHDVYSFLQASGANYKDRKPERCYSTKRDIAVLEFAIGYFPDDNTLERHFPAWLRDYGPITVGVDADHSTFQRYVGGVYEFPDVRKMSVPNHALLLIGYTPSHWILRNSWGTNWGEAGLMRVRRTNNVNAGIGRYVGIITKTSEM